MAVLPPAERPPFEVDLVVLLFCSEAAGEGDDEDEDVLEWLEVASAVDWLSSEVTTTVTGPTEDWPPVEEGVWKTTDVMRRVEGTTEEARTVEVTMLVVEGSTVVVLGPPERMADETEDAMADEIELCSEALCELLATVHASTLDWKKVRLTCGVGHVYEEREKSCMRERR